MMYSKQLFCPLFILLFVFFETGFSIENMWMKSESGLEGRYGNYGESIHLAGTDKIIVTSISKDTSDGQQISGIGQYIYAYDLNGNMLWKTTTRTVLMQPISMCAAIDSSYNILMSNGFGKILRFNLNGQLVDTLNFLQSDKSDISVSCFSVNKSSYFIGGAHFIPGETGSRIAIKQYDYQFTQKKAVYFTQKKSYCSVEMISGSDDYIVCTGIFGETGDTLFVGGKYIVSKSDQDRFIMQFDPEGNMEWALQFSGSDEVSVNQLTLSKDGSVFVCGGYKGKCEIQNLTFNSKGGEDAFVMKVNSSGKIAWIKTWGSDYYDDHSRALSIIDNSIWVTGIAASSFSGVQKSDRGSAFLISFDTAGVVQEDTLLEGNNRSEGGGILASGNALYLTGYFTGKLITGSEFINTDQNEFDLFFGNFRYSQSNGPLLAFKNNRIIRNRNEQYSSIATYDLTGRLMSKSTGLNRSGIFITSTHGSDPDRAAKIIIKRNGRL
jgi:hypothetical protein